MNELIKIRLSPTNKVFRRHIIDVVTLFGFARNKQEALQRIENGMILVNNQTTTIDYVCKVGDLVSCGENGILLESD